MDPKLPRLPRPPLVPATSQGPILSAPLAGTAVPEVGTLQTERGIKPAPGPRDSANRAVQTGGKGGLLSYKLESFPEEDYSAALWVDVAQLPDGRLGQILSAWTGPMDDPLRLCIESGKLFARMESGQGYSTPGIPCPISTWQHLAVVKRGTDLRLFVNGIARGQATVPLLIHSQAKEVGLGGNPRYSGDESVAARYARFSIFERALEDEEIKDLAAWTP